MFRVFKSIVYILLLIPTVGLSRGNDMEALVSHHFTSFPTIDSLDTQAMMHERACAFVLDINDNPIGTGFFVSQNAPAKDSFLLQRDTCWNRLGFLIIPSQNCVLGSTLPMVHMAKLLTFFLLLTVIGLG